MTTRKEPVEAAASEPVPPTEPPRSVIVSFWILIASAAVRVLLVVITAASWSRVVDELLKQPLPAGTTVATARSAIEQNLLVNLILDVVFAAIYVYFAFMVRRGRNWARLAITAIVAVFAVLGVLAASDLFTLVRVLIELAAVGLLFRKPAKAYFAAMRASARG